MADFIKKDWKCGDTITADDLNRLEGGVEEALSKDCDKGYSCTEGWVTLTDESVTTVLPEGHDYPEAQLAYSTPIDSETIKVTFNGTEYTCQKNEQGGYGALWNGASLDWSEYPFSIGYDTDFNANLIFTETAGTYQVKIEVYGETVETSECFDKARGYSCIESVTTYIDETVAFA